MYLPKYKNVYLASISLSKFDVTPDYFPELKRIFNNCWRDCNSWLFIKEKGKSDSFYNFHRSPQDMYGDNGYIRVAAFINLLLHSVYKGSTIYSLLPLPTRAVVIDETMSSESIENQYTIPGKLDNPSVCLSDDEFKTLLYFYKHPALNQLNARMIKIDEVRENVSKIINASFLSSSTFGSTAYNLMVFYIQLMHLIWLEPAELDENGVVKNSLLVDFVKFDLCDLLFRYDFQNIFQQHVLYSSIINVINSVCELSTYGRINTYDMNGFHLLNSFFEQFTDKVFESAQELTQNYLTLRTMAHDFFSEMPKYSTYVRFKKHEPKLLPSEVRGGDEFLIFSNYIGDVDASESNCKEFIEHFESTYSEMMDLWKAFVEFFFIKMSDLPSKGKPILTGYVSEHSGVNTVYGLIYSTPFLKNTISMLEYRDGYEYGDMYASTVGGRGARYIKTRTVDETYKGLNVTELSENYPNYLEFFKRGYNSLIIKRKSLQSDIYELSWTNTCVVIIPPLNPVLEVRFQPALSKLGLASDPEVFVPYTLDMDKISLKHIPFLVRASDFSIAHNSVDPDSALKTLFESTVMECFKVSTFGVENFVSLVPLTRAALLSLSAFLATQSITSADQAIKYLSVDINKSKLNMKEIGAKITIPKALIVPFPYSTNESSAAQISLMEKNYKDGVCKSFGAVDTSHRILTHDSICIDADLPYSPFTDIYKVGLSRVRIGRNIYPKTLEYIDSSDDSWQFNCVSILEPYSTYALKKHIAFNYTEQDFFDPYPNLNVCDTALMLLTCVLSDLLICRNSANVLGSKIDITKSLETLRDVYLFIKKYLRPQGRVHMSSNFDVDKTWKDILDYLTESYAMACQYLNVKNYDATMLQEFLTSFTDALQNFRDSKSIFWNKNGFILQKLYFGDVYKLLVDKYTQRLRSSFPSIGFIDQKYIPVPPMLTGVATSVVRNHIIANLDIILYNNICKELYK